MDITVYFFGRVHLENKVYFWDVKASGYYVGGYETLEFAISEALEGDFSLFLWDVSMKDLTFLFDISIHHDIISFFFGFSEDNRPTMFATIDEDNVSYDRESLMVGTVDG